MLPSYYEEMIGGSEYQSYLFAKEAKQRGHKVHYLFTSRRSDYENPLGIDLHPIDRLRIRRTFGSTRFLYRRRLLRILDEIRPDVVYCRNDTSWVGIAALYAKKHKDCKSILHIPHVRAIIPRPLYTLWRRPFDILEKYWLEYGVRNVTTIVAHAHSQASLLQDNYGRSSETILKMQPEPTEAISKTGPLTVIWVANLKPPKRPELFVDLARALQNESNARLIMIGKAAQSRYVTKIRDQVAQCPNIEFLGEQPIGEVNRLLAESHILVNTCLPEGLPNTFVQAWMREVPVVSMDWDPDDILKNHRLRLLSGSFDNMVKDVLDLLTDDLRRERMGKRAREYALEHHSASKNMNKLMDLVEA